VDANLFHDFHQTWTVNICRALNRGLLSRDFSALIGRPGKTFASGKPMALCQKANRIEIQKPLGQIRCVIEIVSPGNKSSKGALRAFVEKTLQFLDRGVHAVVVDLFPPTSRDPQGIHKAIWDEIEEEPFALLPDKRLTLASYVAGFPHSAFVELVAVGDRLRDMPAYLDPHRYVLVPLESTYQETWESCPPTMQEAVEQGVSDDAE
jgi:hypothetical protein